MYRTALHQNTLHEAALTAGLWIAFFIGGVCAVLANKRWGPFSLSPPIAVLLFLVALDLLRPIAASDEHVVRRA